MPSWSTFVFHSNTNISYETLFMSFLMILYFLPFTLEDGCLVLSIQGQSSRVIKIEYLQILVKLFLCIFCLSVVVMASHLNTFELALICTLR